MSVRAESIPDRNVLWSAAQLVGLVLTVVLLVGLWRWPEPSLRILWYAMIPILPAVFLIHPALWRNVCPLATLNMLPGRFSRGWVFDPRVSTWVSGVGIGLLVLLVPARRFVFNTDGPILALVVIAVALLALALGFLFDRKAGFCNSICPVLPVERLYGQDPLASVSNPRCPTCALCTTRGCIDLVPKRSASQAAGASGRRWTLTTYGAFAAAFPGFVVAYYLIPDGGWVDATAVYATVAAGSATSWAVVSVLVLLFSVESRRALPLLGALALGLYYWFGLPGIAGEWGLGDGLVMAARAAALLLVGVWLWRHIDGAREVRRGAVTVSPA